MITWVKEISNFQLYTGKKIEPQPICPLRLVKPVIAKSQADSATLYLVFTTAAPRKTQAQYNWQDIY